MLATYVADVECVLKKRPIKYGQWTFDVMEYYSEVGLCDQSTLTTFLTQHGESSGKISRLLIFGSTYVILLAMW